MQTQLVVMTPQWAAQILKTANHDNRPIRRAAVKRLAESIKDGMWQITHQGIAIDTNGKLQDGQHRLSAIVEANQPVEILLTTGTYPASYGVLDCGVGRTAADSLERIGTCKNSNRAAAGIKVYLLYKRHPQKIWGNTDAPPQTTIVQFYKENKNTVDWATEHGSSSSSTYRLLNPSALIAFLLLAAEDSETKEKAKIFAKLLATPSMQPEDSPVFAYRRLLEGNSLSKQNLQQRSLACIIKCFNYWANDFSLKQFKQPAMNPMPIIDTSIL